MKKNLQNYLRKLGMSEARLKLLSELGATPLAVSPELMLTAESEDYIERGDKRIQELGDYQIIQIVQNSELTVFFLYREGESEALEDDECIIFAFNNHTEEYSDAAIVKVAVEDGEFIYIC